MKPTTLILLTLLISLKIFSQTDTKTYTLYKGENGSTTVTVFKEKVDSLTKKRSYSSVRGDIDSKDLLFPLNIGVFRRRVNLITKKTRLDTIYFSNYLSEKPSWNLDKEEQKVTIVKIDSSNRYKHYLVYDINDYFGNRDIPKDSIVLDGYFKIIDKLKPPYINSSIKPYTPSYKYEVSEKNFIPPAHREVNCGVLPRDTGNKQNSEGLFLNGFKSGKWTFSSGMKTEEYYVKGLRHGVYTVYNNAKNILYQTTFKNGTGEEKLYHSNGKLYQIKYFKNGFVDYTKPHKDFYSNGNLSRLYDYPNKMLKTYYENGTLSGEYEIEIFDNTVVMYHGVHKGYSYEKPGEMREIGLYSMNNLRNRKVYNYKGEMIAVYQKGIVQFFRKGKLIYMKSENLEQYFKNGKLIKKE